MPPSPLRTNPTASLLVAVLVLAALFLAAPTAAMAPAPSDQPATVEDVDLERAIALIWAEEYAEAEPLLQAALKRNPRNPDAWNYLGFATRKLGELGAARGYYENALRLDPGHLKAMEYLGELYLQTDEPDLARELLARISTLCPNGCEEHDQLAAAIAAYTASQ